MSIQLRAARGGTTALRFAPTCRITDTRHVGPLLVRSASTYSQPGRGNSFGFKPRDREQDGRKSFDRAPRTRFGMQERIDKGDGQQERFGAERPPYRSSSTQGDKAFVRDRPFNGERTHGVNRDRGGGTDRFPRRQPGDDSDRPVYRPSSSQGESKPFNRTDRSNTYEGRKSFERTDKTKYQGRTATSDDGKSFDRADRRTDGARAFELSGRSDTYGERKSFDRAERPAYGARTFDKDRPSFGQRSRVGKAFGSEGRTYERSGASPRPEAGKGYTRNETPYQNVRRSNQESGETETPTSKKPIDLEKRLRIRPGTSPYDASVHLNNYIRNARAPKHSHEPQKNAEYLEVAEEILKTAPKESVNVAVWNVLLAGFAKERKYQRMFKAFNDMKKRGIRPSSRTYAIMLDNYPSSFDAPGKTLSRATLLYDQAQEHVQEILDKIAEAKESEGYELSTDRGPGDKRAQSEDAEAGEDKAQLTLDAYTSGNAVAPTNAYLAQMTHFARFDEVKRVYDAMPKNGPKAPDGKTYTILFEACMARAAKQKSGEAATEATPDDMDKPAAVTAKDAPELFDPIALWKEIVDRDITIRQKIGKGAPSSKSAGRGGPRLMDEQEVPLLDDRLVITALRCFMSGPMEQRIFALDQIVPSVYNLSAPGRSTYSSAVIPENSARFELTERAVETILKLCLAAGRAREGVHYAEQILNMPKAFTDQLTLTHYNAILALYSKENDIDKCLEILDLKPPFLRGEAWPRSSWVYALKAARFASNWDKFLVAFKRMTRMPAVLEIGKEDSPRVGAGQVDDQIASLLLSTATESKKISAMREAMRIFAYYYTGRTPASPTTDEKSTYSRYWRRQLLASLNTCLSAIENAGQDTSSGRDLNEERAWRVLVDGLGSSEKEKVQAPERGRTPERTRPYGERKVSSRPPQRDYMRR